MQRTIPLVPLAIAALVPVPSSHVTSSRDLLKDPIQVRVTSVGEGSVTFLVVRQEGFIQLLTSRPLRRPPDTLHSATPQELIGSGGQFVFIADDHRQIRVEAWRMFGQTKHVAAEGDRITVRAPMVEGVPEVLADSAAVTFSHH